DPNHNVFIKGTCWMLLLQVSMFNMISTEKNFRNQTKKTKTNYSRTRYNEA
ncbi:5030_t:CDS:1, partial [Entrophospora sp. SA101]